MPKKKKEYSVVTSMRTMESFPTVLERNPRLLPELERRSPFKNDDGESAKEMLENWKNQKNLDRFSLLGWLKGCLDQMGMSAIFYITLDQKNQMSDCIQAILFNATDEEKEAYKNQFKKFITDKKAHDSHKN